jgi:hypothetical protein
LLTSQQVDLFDQNQASQVIGGTALPDGLPAINPIVQSAIDGAYAIGGDAIVTLKPQIIVSSGLKALKVPENVTVQITQNSAITANKPAAVNLRATNNLLGGGTSDVVGSIQGTLQFTEGTLVTPLKHLQVDAALASSHVGVLSIGNALTITSTGRLLSDGGLIVRGSSIADATGPGTPFTLINNGLIQSSGNMTVINGPAYSFTGSGTLRSNNGNILITAGFTDTDVVVGQNLIAAPQGSVTIANCLNCLTPTNAILGILDNTRILAGKDINISSSEGILIGNNVFMQAGALKPQFQHLIPDLNQSLTALVPLLRAMNAFNSNTVQSSGQVRINAFPRYFDGLDFSNNDGIILPTGHDGSIVVGDNVRILSIGGTNLNTLPDSPVVPGGVTINALNSVIIGEGSLAMAVGGDTRLNAGFGISMGGSSLVSIAKLTDNNKTEKLTRAARSVHAFTGGQVAIMAGFYNNPWIDVPDGMTVDDFVNQFQGDLGVALPKNDGRLNSLLRDLHNQRIVAGSVYTPEAKDIYDKDHRNVEFTLQGGGLIGLFDHSDSGTDSLFGYSMTPASFDKLFDKNTATGNVGGQVGPQKSSLDQIINSVFVAKGGVILVDPPSSNNSVQITGSPLILAIGVQISDPAPPETPHQCLGCGIVVPPVECDGCEGIRRPPFALTVTPADQQQEDKNKKTQLLLPTAVQAGYINNCERLEFKLEDPKQEKELAEGEEPESFLVAAAPFTHEDEDGTALVGEGGTIISQGGKRTVLLKEGRVMAITGKQGVVIQTKNGRITVPANGAVIVEHQANGASKVEHLSGPTVAVALPSEKATLNADQGDELIFADHNLTDEELIPTDGVAREPIEGGAVVVGKIHMQRRRFDYREMAQKEQILQLSTNCASDKLKKRLSDIRNVASTDPGKKTSHLRKNNATGSGAWTGPVATTGSTVGSGNYATTAGGPATAAASTAVEGDAMGRRLSSDLKPIAFLQSPAKTPAILQSLTTGTAEVKHTDAAQMEIKQNNEIVVKSGETLVSSSERTIVHAGDALINVAPGAVAMIHAHNGVVKVRNMFDKSAHSVVVFVNNRQIDVPVGQEAAFGSHDVAVAQAIKSDSVGRRRIRHVKMANNKAVMLSDVSLLSILQNSELLARIMDKNDSANKALRNKLLRMAAVLSTVTAKYGAYAQMQGK